MASRFIKNIFKKIIKNVKKKTDTLSVWDRNRNYDDIFRYICQFLIVTELLHLKRVCKHWNKISQHATSWKYTKCEVTLQDIISQTISWKFVSYDINVQNSKSINSYNLSSLRYIRTLKIDMFQNQSFSLQLWIYLKELYVLETLIIHKIHYTDLISLFNIITTYCQTVQTLELLPYTQLIEENKQEKSYYLDGLENMKKLKKFTFNTRYTSQSSNIYYYIKPVSQLEILHMYAHDVQHIPLCKIVNPFFTNLIEMYLKLDDVSTIITDTLIIISKIAPHLQKLIIDKLYDLSKYDCNIILTMKHLKEVSDCHYRNEEDEELLKHIDPQYHTRKQIRMRIERITTQI
jgi:hypothetical protein